MSKDYKKKYSEKELKEMLTGLQYHVTKEEMLNAIDSLIGNHEMRERLKKVKQRIIEDRSKEKLADKLEELALAGPKEF